MAAMATEIWFPCPSCDLMVTGRVREGHPHPEKHEVYSYTHCCLLCEQGLGHGDEWSCAGVPSALFRRVMVDGKAQHYLLHDPGEASEKRPVLLFLHGAHTHIYPEFLWGDLRDLVEQNPVARDFIVLCPFGAEGEAIATLSTKRKPDRYYNEVPNIKCFDPDKTWAFFMTALRELENRFDASQLHITGYSMGGETTWALGNFFGSHVASIAPMAARALWEEDSWEEDPKISKELQGFKWDFKAFSFDDMWYVSEKHGLQLDAVEESTVTAGPVVASVHSWSPRLSLSLLENTPTSHWAWTPVLHNEAEFGLFSKMLSVRCASPPDVACVRVARYPASP